MRPSPTRAASDAAHGPGGSAAPMRWAMARASADAASDARTRCLSAASAPPGASPSRRCRQPSAPAGDEGLQLARSTLHTAVGANRCAQRLPTFKVKFTGFTQIARLGPKI
jgi:hypothetical protein